MVLTLRNYTFSSKKYYFWERKFVKMPKISRKSVILGLKSVKSRILNLK